MFLLKKNIIALGAAVTLSGCIPVAKAVTEGTKTNDGDINLYCKLEPEKEENKLTKPLTIDIHVDGSGSMLGYVNPNNSSYIQALQLLERIPDWTGSRSNSQVEYYRSGDSKNPAIKLTRNEFNIAQKPKFYNGKSFPNVTSDLASIVSYPTNKKSNLKPGSNLRDSLTVIVTDLDQNDGDVNLIASKIKQKYFSDRDKNYAVGIWGIKSEFNGTVYSASNPNSKFGYGKNSKQYRPFYILFLGHYQDIKAYIDKLQKEQNFSSDRSKFLIFSPNNLVKEISYLNSPTNLAPGVKKVSSLHNGKIAVEKNKQPVELLEIINEESNSLEYEVSFQATDSSLAIAPEDIETKITTRYFKNGKFKEIASANNALNFDNWKIDRDRLNFTTTINPNNLPESNIYYFAVDVIPKDLQKPTWWKEWNLTPGTYDGSKTTNLYRFMNDLKNITLNEMNKSDLIVARFCYGIQKN